MVDDTKDTLQKLTERVKLARVCSRHIAEGGVLVPWDVLDEIMDALWYFRGRAYIHEESHPLQSPLERLIFDESLDVVPRILWPWDPAEEDTEGQE